MLDFESPNPGVEWRPAALAGTTRPAEQPSQINEGANATQAHTGAEADVLGRSSVRPRDGLWSLKINVKTDGEILHAFGRTRDLRKFDTLTAAVMHTDAPGRGGEWMARIFIVDEYGNKVIGDPLPVTVRWQDLLLDLKTAEEEGVDLERVVSVGLALVNVRAKSGEEGTEAPLEIQTDTWAGGRDYRVYEGQKTAKGRSFYTEREGTQLRIGMTGQYEITFYQRSGTERPWLAVSSGNGDIVLGRGGTGLMLLDQDRFDSLGEAVRQDGFAQEGEVATGMPTVGWPVRVGNPPAAEGTLKRELREKGLAESVWRWECVWTSPVGAIVELKQEVGPYDRLGEPAARLSWRFMIYQWGQMFVHVDWATREGQEGGPARPISWALVTEEGAGRREVGGVQAKSPADAERLLSAIYPASVKEGLRTALPHQMQTGAAVAMIAKPDRASAGKNVWWWARGGGRRIFGTGLSTQPGTSSADCMLLLNGPDALMQASSFGAYLAPPKVRLRQGELDRNFPGDVDNDGLVDSYGFQVVRLASGRASFMIYPQERPLFYPPYLFTVPAVEREAVDLAHSRVLINIDGKQFADPPRFPDGSYLLQLPYVIDRPVAVEAILVKK